MLTFNQTWKAILDIFSISTPDFNRYKSICVSESSLRNWRTRSLPDNQEQLNNALDFLCEKIEKRAANSLKVYVSYIVALIPNNNISIGSPFELSGFVRDLLTSLFIVEDTNRKRNKNIMVHQATNAETPQTKAVIFDFDGTLTAKKTTQSTWENIWVLLGYSVKDCQDLHAQFNSGKIKSHQEWCDLTAKRFIEKNLNKIHLNQIVSQISLMDDIEEVFKFLTFHDIKIYIVSGSIFYIINSVLGELRQYVREIKANEFDFDNAGNLTRIIGTKYDFEGKAKYITEVANMIRYPTSNILFVGNSNNDKYAHLSGARTLCINPHLADPTDEKIWNSGSIQQCDSLKEILKYVILA